MHCAELNCADFKVRLDAVLDARRSPQRDGELSAHAQQCPRCAEWMAAHATLLGAVQEIPAPTVRFDFSASVIGRLEHDRRRKNRQRLGALAALALAAGVLIAVAPWHSWKTAPGPTIAPSERPQRSIALDDSYQRLVAETRSFAGNLTSQKLDWMEEVADGFRPVTVSVYTALHSLWRTLPGSNVARTLLL